MLANFPEYLSFSANENGHLPIADKKASNSCGEYFNGTPPFFPSNRNRLVRLLPNKGWENGRCVMTMSCNGHKLIGFSRFISFPFKNQFIFPPI